MSKKRILITGGAGLVGSHAAEYFVKKGNQVIVFDNLMRSKIFGINKESVEYNWVYLRQFPLERIKGDVRRTHDLLDAISYGVDVIIHTAGQPGVPSSVKDPMMDFSINAAGTLNVLECARQVCPNATVIYCSTNKIYSGVNDYPLKELEKQYKYWEIDGIDENVRVDGGEGHTPYGVSKLVGDLYMQEYYHTYKMKTGVFRMSCTYGTRQFGFEEQGWVAWFIIANLLNRMIAIYGDGKQVRDLLYVDDLIKAFDLFIENKDIQHGIYNIGGGPENTLSLLEFIDILEEEMGKKPYWYTEPWRPSDQKVYISDIRKIKKELGWQPETDYKDGIRKLIDWAVENKHYFL